MSIFGIDLLDGIGFGRYVSDDESTNRGEQQRDSESRAVSPFSFDDILLEQSSAAAPPAWIEVDNSDVLEVSQDEISVEGITILSSVPSSQVSPPMSPAASAGILATSAHAPPDSASWSISTTPSLYFGNSSKSSLSLLSLHPSSLASSELETLSPRDSAVSLRHTPSVFTRVAERHLALPSHENNRLWYSDFSDEDWDRFQARTSEILSALGETVDDRMVAQLIQQEEYFFWSEEAKRVREMQRRNLRHAILLCGETALLVALSIAGFRWSRH